jgi:hypothetical protein
MLPRPDAPYIGSTAYSCTQKPGLVPFLRTTTQGWKPLVWIMRSQQTGIDNNTQQQVRSRGSIYDLYAIDKVQPEECKSSLAADAGYPMTGIPPVHYPGRERPDHASSGHMCILTFRSRLRSFDHMCGHRNMCWMLLS